MSDVRLCYAFSLIAPMPKKPRALSNLADRFCEAIKELTAERQTRTCAAQMASVRPRRIVEVVSLRRALPT
jgi:hypothetical protein